MTAIDTNEPTTAALLSSGGYRSLPRWAPWGVAAGSVAVAFLVLLVTGTPTIVSVVAFGALVHLVVLTVLGFVMAIPSIGTLMAQGAVTLIFTFFITVLQIIAIIHLFRPDAKAWLESRGTMGTNPDIFS